MATVPEQSILHQEPVVEVIKTVVESGVTIGAVPPVAASAPTKGEYDALRETVVKLRAALIAAGIVVS